jgi:hypothetical protein
MVTLATSASSLAINAILTCQRTMLATVWVKFVTKKPLLTFALSIASSTPIRQMSRTELVKISCSGALWGSATYDWILR